MGVGGTISGYMDGVSGWNENGDGRGTAGDRTPPNGEGKLAAPAPVPIADRPPLPMPPPPWPLPYPPLSRAVASWKPPPKWPASSGDGSAMGDGKTWPPASEAEGRRLPLTLPTPPALPPTPPALLPGPMALPHPPPPTPRYDNNVCGVVAPDVGSPPLPTALGRAWRKSPKAATAVATVRAAMGRQFAHHSCRVQVAAARRHHCDYRRRRCHRRCRRCGGRVTAAYAVWSAWSTAWSMAQPVQRYRYPVAVGAWSRPRRCPTLVGPHRRCRVATPAPALPVTLPCCRPRGRRWQRRPPPPLLHVRPPSVCPRGEGSAGGSAAAAPPSSHRRQRQERCHWRSHSPSRLPLRR